MAGTKNKAIAIEPLWILGIEAHTVAPKSDRNASRSHSRTRMSAFEYLGQIRAKASCSVDDEFFLFL